MNEEVKNTRLFDETGSLDVETIVNSINEWVKKDNSLIDDGEQMSRWVSLPSLLLQSKTNQQVFVDFVKYLDELLIDNYKKIAKINTMAYLLSVVKIRLNTFDINSLYTLVDYLNEVPVSNFKQNFELFKNPKLLEAVRHNTLDIDKRRALLHYFMEQTMASKIDLKDKKSISDFQTQVILVLQDKTADEILGLENYMNGKVTERIEFRDSLSN